MLRFSKLNVAQGIWCPCMRYRFASSRLRSCSGPFPDTTTRVRASLVASLSLAFAASAIFAMAAQVEARPADATEYQVKAAYLYNFGKFVAWPEGPDERATRPFAICVLGEDPFGTALDSALGGATIHGSGVVAKRIGKVDEIDDCRILFISSSEMGRLPQVLAGLNKTGVLTVSDIPQFSQRGGMIQFVSDRNKIRFEINVTNAEDAGLRLSSELLKVAVRVTGTPRRGL